MKIAAIPLSLFGLAGLSILLHPFLTGCGNERPVQAQTTETRITEGEGTKHYPRFSPDGRSVAYSTKEGVGQTGGWAVCFLPASGGTPAVVTPDSASQYAIDWTPDGKAILAYDDGSKRICRVALDGRIEESYAEVENAYVEDVSPDGDRFLAFRFNSRDYDVGILTRTGGDAFRPIAETPEWELYGSFGPGPGDVTFCRFGTYQSPVSDVVVWTAADGGFTTLPLPKGRHSTPSWSLDGRYMAWISTASGNPDVWIYEAETGRAVQATRTPDEENAPHWSPDGERIAFSRESRSSHLYVAGMRDRTKRPLTEGPDWDGYPVRSLAGEWVAFLRRPASSSSGKLSIHVLSLEEGVARPLDLGNLTPHVSRHFASWSPDAGELAFAAEDASGNVDIYRIQRAGGVPVRVTIDPGMDTQPAWSPDGSTIAYLRSSEGISQIFAIPATGGLATALTPDQGFHEGLVWSPDSDHIAYFRANGMERFEVWTTSARVPGTTRMILPEDTGNFPQRWTPDGKELIVAKVEDKRYAFFATTLDGKQRTLVAYDSAAPEKRPFLEFTPEGEAYFDVFYPDGRYVYPDGETRSDLYILRARDVLQSKVVS